ncbi:CO2 hydration protein [Synechococcus sp. RSCCF101]|uniref:CO2 hydration protein n=1 Tax=Synechococcus sp. RSCCF101 TaxID=2511069 RepID=UPI0012473F2F|nr:CO2 hydration protein [Synechococcus sp. RSCCF101]QEY31330.1 CO2 hydration protein [Synechococcus sp. RSCCF101]
MSAAIAARLQEQLLAGRTLVDDTADHLLQVVGVLDSYGVVLDAYSRNLIDQAQRQFLNPLPALRFFNGQLTAAGLLRHLNGDRINFEYAEYCQKAMLWHGTGGLDAYLDSPAFQETCRAIVAHRRRRDPLVRLLDPLFPGFLPEYIRSSATTHALGLFWRVMSDLFASLADRHRRGRVRSVDAAVDTIRDGLVAAAADPIRYSVHLDGVCFEVLPAEADLRFLADVAVPYVEAVFLRGMPFLGTVSFNAQAGQIPSEQAEFRYGALYADPLPTMGAGIPPSLLMQDMYRHLPPALDQWYLSHGRGAADAKVQICVSFQKAMFCVTNAAIRGTFPHPLTSEAPDARQANRAHAAAWATRLSDSRLDALTDPDRPGLFADLAQGVG